MNDQTIEQDIQAKGLTAPRITPFDVEAEIHREFVYNLGAAISFAGGITLPILDDHREALSQITVYVLILKNGHRIVGVNEGPVSAANFDAELGRKMARQNAIDQVWPLLGFRLRDRLSGTWQD